jgi:hypothetical protein
MVCFALVACATRSSLAERPIERAPSDVLRIPASRFHDSKLTSQVVDFHSGIGPDEAATIAVYSNPVLRAIRDRRGLAVAQLIQARILPNVVVSYARDYVTGGNTAGAVTAYNFSAGWEFSALVPFLPKQTAARKNFRSVELDFARQEWQIAVNARTAVYRVLALDAQVVRAREATNGLQGSTDAMREAVNAHEKTVLELAAVESKGLRFTSALPWDSLLFRPAPQLAKRRPAQPTMARSLELQWARSPAKAERRSAQEKSGAPAISSAHAGRRYPLCSDGHKGSIMQR